MRTHSVTRLVAVVALIAATAACGKSSGGSPVAPSAAAATSAGSGASISGVVLSGSSSSISSLAGLRGFASAQSVMPGSMAAVGGGGFTVTVAGTSIRAVTDGGGNFTLQNVPPGNLTLSISGAGVSAQVALAAVNTSEQITLTVTVSGGSATVEDQQRVAAGNQAEVDGQIVLVNGSTIVVGHRNIAVDVPASTPITQGGATKTFRDLIVGVRVEVHGTWTGGSVTATSVHISGGGTQNTPDDNNHGPNGNGPTRREISGAIASAITGACPALQFTIQTTVVKTDQTTHFDNVACTSLLASDTLAVEGLLQTDGSILAAELTRTHAGGSGADNGKADDGNDDGGHADGGGDDHGGRGNGK